MSEPTAYLYPNGNAAYLDDDGKQIIQYQQRGIRGLRGYRMEYPDSTVYWATWQDYRHDMSDDEITHLIETIWGES